MGKLHAHIELSCCMAVQLHQAGLLTILPPSLCDLAETDRVRGREKGTETGQVNESVSVILRYKEMMAGNAEHAMSLKLVLVL